MFYLKSVEVTVGFIENTALAAVIILNGHQITATDIAVIVVTVFQKAIRIFLFTGYLVSTFISVINFTRHYRSGASLVFVTLNLCLRVTFRNSADIKKTC